MMAPVISDMMPDALVGAPVIVNVAPDPLGKVP